MPKQRDRHTKAGPVGSGLLRFGERRKREGEGVDGEKRAAAAGRQNFTESLLFSNHCAIIPVTMVINER